MFYNYLFYYLYYLVSKTPSKNDVVFMTILAMILPVILNFVFLIGCIEYIFSVDVDMSNTHIVLLSVLLLCINYFLYMHKERYIQVVKNIESKSNIITWKWIMIACVGITLLMFFGKSLFN